MPGPKSVRDLINDPKFQELDPEAKSQVYAVVSARDTEFAALPAEAQSQIRTLALGGSAGSPLASGQPKAPRPEDISPELAAAASQHAADLRRTPNPMSTTPMGGGPVWEREAETPRNIVIDTMPEKERPPLPVRMLHGYEKAVAPIHGAIERYVNRPVSAGINAVGAALENMGKGLENVPVLSHINAPAGLGKLISGREQLAEAAPAALKAATGIEAEPGPRVKSILNTAGSFLNEGNLPFFVMAPLAKSKLAKAAVSLGFSADQVPGLYAKWQEWQQAIENGEQDKITQGRWEFWERSTLAALIAAHGGAELKGYLDEKRPLTPAMLEKFAKKIERTVPNTLQEVVKDPQTGRTITKNPPGSPLAQALAADEAGTTNPVDAVKNLAQTAGLKQPEVRMTDTPVSKTEGEKVTLAPDAGPAESKHEVEHLAENEGKGPTPPEGPGAKEPDLDDRRFRDRRSPLGSEGPPEGMEERREGERREQPESRFQGPPAPEVEPEKPGYTKPIRAVEYGPEQEKGQPKLIRGKETGRTRMTWLQSPEAQALRDQGAPMHEIIQKELEHRTPKEQTEITADAVSPPPEEVVQNPTPSKFARFRKGFGQAIDHANALLQGPSEHTGVPKSVMDIMFNYLGEKNMERAGWVMDAIREKARNYLEKFDDATRVRWMDMVSDGKIDQIEDPLARDVFKTLQRGYDAIYKTLNAYKDIDYVPGYSRRMWKVVPNKIEELEALFQVDPNTPTLEGNKGWTKERQLKFLRQGMALGGKLYSTNPVDIFGEYWINAKRFIAAQNAIKASVDTGNAVLVKRGEGHPDGFVTLDDPIARRGSSQYYFTPWLAQMLKNAYSRDYLREGMTVLGGALQGPTGAAGRSLMTFKNLYTQLELGFSGFHFGAITNEATASDIGHSILKFANDGVRQGVIALSRGDIPGVSEAGSAAIKGLTGAMLKLVAGTPIVSSVSAWRYFNEGGKLMRAINDPEDFMAATDSKAFVEKMKKLGFDSIDEAIRAPFKGGAEIGVSQDYKLSTYQAFMDALAKDNYLGAAIHSIPGLADMISGPLFNHYIPRIKLGFYLNEYGQRLKYYAQELAEGRKDKSAVAREAWRTTENRFGEMNFGTLFWNRAVQSTLQLLFRSVTWRLGSVRQYSDATTSQLRELYGTVLGGPENWNPVFRGEKSPLAAGKQAWKYGELPRLTPDMAWGAGVALVHMAQSAVIQWMFTHTMPTKLDWLFPRVGGKNSLGQDNRIVPPTYARDLYYLLTDAGRYVQSGLSGPIGKVLGSWILQQDYYGEAVHGPGEALASGAPIPIGGQSYQRVKEAGAPEGAAALSMVGATKAPRGIGVDPDEQLVLDHARKFTGAQEPGDFERRRQLSLVRAEIRRRGYPESVARKMLEKLDLTPAQLEIAVKDSQERDPFVPMIRRMGARDLLQLLDEMSDAGVKRWGDIIGRRLDSAEEGDFKSLRKGEVEEAQKKIRRFRGWKKATENLIPAQLAR